MNTDAGHGETQWRRCDDRDCAWADCGDGFVLYHRPSGKTHLMNDASVEMLSNVLSEPKSLLEIAAAFDPRNELAGTDVVLERMKSLLVRLEQFGLVERV